MNVSIIDFQPSGITPYLDWLNFDDCRSFEYYDEKPWTVDDSFNILLSLEESQEELLTDYFWCGRITIVSERMKLIISEVNSNVQFVPVRIMCGERPDFLYYGLHVMSILDLIDREKTQFAGIKYDMVAGITSLVLKEQPVNDICLLKDTFTSITIVSERLRHLIESAELTGVKFIALSEYEEETRGI